MDIQKLLGQFLGTGGQGTTGSHPVQNREGQGGGSLVDQLGGMLQGGGSGSGLGGLLQGGAGSALGGALAGGLATSLFRGKGVGKLGGTALKLGGAALVAGLAYKAYQSYQAQQGQTALPGAEPLRQLPSTTAPGEIPEPKGTAFLPAGEEDVRSRLMLSAMISAAKADGYIDANEEQAIFGRIDELDLDAEEKGFLVDEMRRPMTPEQLASRATTPEIAMEVYTASLLAIDADHPAERAYLDRLAAQLKLPPELAAQIRRTTGEVQG
ncbi:MAG: tellurite resistance TerB family protein [Aurantimonas endophytica]|uniref:tellurite resistance TerB family protein n=1 Tax=Aurantimonas endophytica TaxID=1522175 RepID=UPI0030037842